MTVERRSCMSNALWVIDLQPIYVQAEPMITSDGDDLIAKCNAVIGKAQPPV